MITKTGEYFPIQFKYVATFLLIASLPLIIEGGLRLVGVGLFLISLAVLTARYEFEIDKERKRYREYVRILWMKPGKWQEYQTVEYCYLTASSYTQKMQLRAANTTLSGVEMNAYLKFSENEKIHIGTGRNKEKLMKSVNKVADYLGVDIIDRTSE